MVSRLIASLQTEYDLAGVQVYKFRMGNLLCLLAYRLPDENTLKLLMVGPHENFYRDLKRTEH